MYNLINKYDIFLVDIYGVIWNGNSIIPHSLEALQEMKNQGKKVVILTNNTNLNESVETSYIKKGLIKNQHYDCLVSSGSVFKDSILENIVINPKNPTSKKVYIFGTKKKALFENTDYEIVATPEEASFVYISIPQLTIEEKANLNGKFADEIFTSKLPKEGEPDVYDSTNIEVFRPVIQDIFKRNPNLQVLVANPDKTAAEGDKISNEVHFVIRQGAIGDLCREFSDDVVEFGKPNVKCYDYTKKLIMKHFNLTEDELSNQKILMIGDTMETDILGAQNSTKNGFKVDSLLLKTGVAFNNQNGKTIEEQAKKLNMNMSTHILENLSINNE